ncbi:WhiB family transcriptional regulator [Streptomyces olivaceiscleroticus]|uniref:Transcriptional regulator WhiB n=1 Tax=Streptomyces olivaceiscleroticus TaxID=68245 RepID=A0ABP3LKW7_9ACTN
MNTPLMPRYETGRVTTPISDSDWQRHKACTYQDWKLFTSEDGADQEIAKGICNSRCTVRLQCLQYALDNREAGGVFGGTTPNDREELLGRKRIRPAGGNPEPMWRQILRVPERRSKLIDLREHGWEPGRIATVLHTNVQTINRALRVLDEEAKALDAASEAVAS